MARVGIITHHRRDAAADHLGEMATWLAADGHDVVLPATDAAAIGTDEEAGAAFRGVPDKEFGGQIDLLVSLGGDGSILRAVDLIGASDVPILGINHGELGYLAAVEVHDARVAVAKALAGDATVEERMMVAATVVGSNGEHQHHALNDIVVERGATSTTIRLDVSIDGDHFHTYAADGIIVASPTGSTAYSLSARGPVLAPDHHALLVTPVSPHQLFDRSMILSPSSVVDLHVTGYREARLAVDGRTVTTLDDGQVVRCTVSERTAKLLTIGPRRFHEVLKAKFGLRDR